MPVPISTAPGNSSAAFAAASASARRTRTAWTTSAAPTPMRILRASRKGTGAGSDLVKRGALFASEKVVTTTRAMTGGSGDGDAPADDGEDGGQTDGHREIPGDRRDRGLNELIRAFLHRARRDAARRRMRKPWKGERDKSSNLRCARCAPPGARWAAGLRAAALSAARPAFARDGRLREPPADSHVIAGVRQAPGGGGRVRGHRRRPHARARRARPPSVVLARRLRPAQRAPRAVAGRGRRRAHRAAGVHAARGHDRGALRRRLLLRGSVGPRARPGGWGAARVDGGNAGLAMARASSSPEVGGWEGRYAPRAARVPEGFQHRHRMRLDDDDDAPWAPGAARERHRRWTTTTTTDDDVLDPDPPRRRRSGSRSHVPRRAGSAGRRARDDEDRRGSVPPSRVRLPSGAKETRRGGGETRDENHRLAARVDGKEDTAGGDAAGGGFDELERRIRATVFQP